MDKNFKNIKETIANLIFLSESSKNDDLGKTWKNAMNEIKGSPILKRLFLVYEGISHNKFDNLGDAESYLNENFSTFSNYKKSDILNETAKLEGILGDYLLEAKDNDVLMEIIMESTSDKRLSKIVERMSKTKSLAKSMIQEPTDSSCEDTETENEEEMYGNLSEKFDALNEKYSFLNEQERNIVRAFVTNNNELKEEIFNDLVSENIKFIKQNLFEADEDDVDLINLLKETETYLKSMEFKESVSLDEFKELIDLKQEKPSI